MVNTDSSLRAASERSPSDIILAIDQRERHRRKALAEGAIDVERKRLQGEERAMKEVRLRPGS